ncbi:hypothetical protein [Streptomyces sp. DB-54]
MSETPTRTLQHRSDGPEDAPVLVLGAALGTTWHMYDVTTGLWQITWISPKLPSYFSQVGRPDGAGGMIQEGTDSQGRRSRWTFTDVTPTSFHWQGFSAAPDGEFELFQEMHATRR